MLKLKIDFSETILGLPTVSDRGVETMVLESRLNPLFSLVVAQKNMLPKVPKDTNIAIHSSSFTGLSPDGGFVGVSVMVILFV